MAVLKFKRGTRAQLNAAASGSLLNLGEPYLITDEGRLAVGTAAGTYETVAKEVHGHSTADVSGLGTIATQAASNVSITGGAISGVTLSASSVTATGLTNGRVPVAGTGGLLGNSPVYTNGTNVGIGASPSVAFHVYKSSGDNIATIQAGTNPFSVYTNSVYNPAVYWKAGQDLGFFTTTNGITLTGASDRHVNFTSTGSVLIGTTTSTGPKLEVNGDVGLTAGYVQFTEMTAPAAPAANGARLFVEDNGSGKTRLVVRFASGANQVLATEP